MLLFQFYLESHETKRLVYSLLIGNYPRNIIQKFEKSKVSSTVAKSPKSHSGHKCLLGDYFRCTIAHTLQYVIFDNVYGPKFYPPSDPQSVSNIATIEIVTPKYLIVHTKT